MTDSVIQMQGVGKRYRRGELNRTFGSLRETITGALRNKRSRDGAAFWALEDIDLEVPRGQALGIVGRNGAGKTTLLRVLARITEPTRGVSRTRGRVGTFLDVGTGFHPELTGRENVYLNAAILGVSRAEVRRKLDDIVAFAEVDAFLDTPLKRYSSGMSLRLAFSVAAHLEPEILVVDEVLAVGDQAFQEKSLARLRSSIDDGRTVLFVSHDLHAIRRTCDEVLWLDRGRVRMRGPADEVLDAYLDDHGPGLARKVQGGDGVVEDLVARVEDASGAPITAAERGEPARLVVRFRLGAAVHDLDCAVFLQTVQGLRILDEAWSDATADRALGPGSHQLALDLPSVLAVGGFQLGVWIGSGGETLAHDEDAWRVQLTGDDRGRSNRLLQLDVAWRRESLEEPS